MKKLIAAAGVGFVLILAQSAASAASGVAALLNDSDSLPAKATPAESASVPTTADRASDLTPAHNTAGSAVRLTDAVEATVLPAGSAGDIAVSVSDRLAVPAPAWNAALSSATQSATQRAMDSKFSDDKSGRLGAQNTRLLFFGAAVAVAVAVVAANDDPKSD